MPHFWQPFLTFNIFFTIWRGEKFWNQVLAPFCWIALSSMYPFSHILLQEARRNQTASSTLCLETPSASIASCTFHVIAVDNFATFSAYYKARIPLPSVFNNLFFIFFWVFLDSTLKAQIYTNSSKQCTAFSTMFLKILLAINCYPVPRLLPHLWIFVQQHSLSGTKICIGCLLLCNKLPQNLGA